MLRRCEVDVSSIGVIADVNQVRAHTSRPRFAGWGRRLAGDVVLQAVAAGIVAGLLSAFLLARLAFIAAGFGALPLVERDAARVGGGRGRRAGGRRSHGQHAGEERRGERIMGEP